MNKFAVKIIGIIFDPEKRMVLIGKNFDDELFSFLEGDLLEKEELDKSLKRVTEEKTGYKIHNLGAVYAENKISEQKDLLKLYFLCEATSGKDGGKEKPGKNVEELRWIKPKQIEKELKIKLPTRLKEYIFGLE